MIEKYTIYVVNQSSDTQKFWCFLSQPQAINQGAEVFANSAANISIESNYQGIVSFVIPVQFVVGAGATNQAVGLDVEIVSAISHDSNTGDIWQAGYKTAPPNMGPDLDGPTPGAPANTIQIVSNSFDKAQSEANGWFSNQTLGILTESGFIGMSWSPEPGKTRTITPKVKFFVSDGDFGSNTLAAWTDISTSCQAAAVPEDFSFNKATITYNSRGSWSIKPGAPSLTDLISYAGAGSGGGASSDDALVKAALIYFSLNDERVDTVASVTWEPGAVATSTGHGIHLTGTLTVGKALGAAFAYFVLAGTTFTITGSSKGATAFKFSYTGTLAAEHVKALFKGKPSIFLGSKSQDA